MTYLNLSSECSEVDAGQPESLKLLRPMFEAFVERLGGEIRECPHYGLEYVGPAPGQDPEDRGRIVRFEPGRKFWNGWRVIDRHRAGARGAELEAHIAFFHEIGWALPDGYGQPPKPANDNWTAPRWPGIISSGDMVRGFVPPDYHVDGIIQAGFLYSVTASTGSGKTAILLLLAALTGLGENLGDREVRKGRVIYFAGENPDDVTMRWIAMAHHMGFDPEAIDVHFVPGTFGIPALLSRIETDVEALGGADLVVVDTSAAYFQGQDENANVELGRHARDLRRLTELPGAPCVLVACHPTKNAGPDNLLPRGGGAFLAEVDGNLSCVKRDDSTVVLHHQGKHRGPDFKPVPFELRTVTAPGLRDTRGRDVPTVLAAALSDGEAAGRSAEARSDVDEVLLQVERGAGSIADIAASLGWLGQSGNPQKSRVHRALDRLRRGGLVKQDARKGYVLTKAGQEAAVEARHDKHWRASGEAAAEALVRSKGAKAAG